MTSYWLHKRCWAMFEPTLTWQNFSFGKLLTELAYIMTTYDFLWVKPAILSNIWTDFSLIHFQFLVNFSHELAHMMTTYNFLSAKTSDSEQCLNWLQLDPISLLVNFSHELAYILYIINFLHELAHIMIIIWLPLFEPTLNLTWFYFCSTFDMNWVK